MDKIRVYGSGKVWIPASKIDEAKRIGLLQFFKATRPGDIKSVGSEYCLKSHESLRLALNGMWNWFSQGVGGKNAMDYLMKVENYSFQDAVLTVLGETPSLVTDDKKESFTEPSEKVLQIPERDYSNDKAIEYLLNRGIDKEVISFFIDRGDIYQTKDYKNVCFIGRDEYGTPKLANLRGTAGDFKGMATGSDRRYGFGYITEKNGIHIFEAPIDLLSFATLIKSNGFDFRKFSFLSLSGVNVAQKNIKESKVPPCLTRVLELHPDIKKIYVHFDNDNTGFSAALALKTVLTDKEVNIQPPPKGYKDVNEYLCSLGKDAENSLDR